VRRLAVTLGLALLCVLPLRASSRKRSHGRSAHAEITAVARVESVPQRRAHKNRREFEELDVTILSAESAPDGDARGDPDLPLDTRGRVHVVHDLTCGGTWVDLVPGDRVEIRGEYVHPPRGGALIHFTHPADASCGRGSHADGYLRLVRAGAAASSSEKAFPPVPDLFASAVRPVLTRRCAPCHEKGGKMYERLPFDDPTVVSSHADGVRRRLKGEDLAALERWLVTLPQTPTPGS
jgi:hypothetical protein